MSRLRVSVLITFLASNGSTAVFFVVSLVLARLLSPDQIGVFSMTAVLIGIAHVFRDFGVSSYLLQEKELTPQKIRSASGVLITSSWLLGAGMFAASGTIADYLHEPRTREVMRVLACGFFFIPFGAITHTLLTREYRAHQQAWVYASGTSAYAISAVWMAYAGFGYMAMAWANLINIIVTGVSYAFFRPRNAPWLPSFKGWRRVTDFGGASLVGGTLGQINNALPDIWLGKSNGAHDVGLLSRAGGTASIVMQIAGPTINYAALPHLAKEHHLGESLSPALCKGSAYLAVCAWPPLAAIALYAHEVVQFLYGPQWLECVPLVRLFCICFAIGVTSQFHVAGLQAIGRPFLAILPQAAALIARAACILLMFDGSLLSFGWGLVLASVLTVPANLAIQAKYFALHHRDFARALWPSLAVTLICGAVMGAVHAATPIAWPALARLSVLAVVICPVWFVAVVLVRHPLVGELQRLGARVPVLAQALGLIMRQR